MPGPVASRVIAPARALQVPSPADPVLQSEAEVDALPLDPVVVGRVATDGGSSDSLEEASDTTARLPQAAPAALPDLPLTCAPLSAVADVPDEVPDEVPARKMFVQEPTPHAKNFFCGGIWVCNCGETDCPYMESGYSPKKEPAPPVLNQWKPDLTMNGSSSTDCARAQAQSGVPKVTHVSARERTRRKDVSLPGVENHRRTNLLPVMPSQSSSTLPTSSSHSSAQESKEPVRSSNPLGVPGKQPKLKR